MADKIEAKDTVMKTKWMNKQVQEDQDRLLLKQADISFKAGIKKGRQEVIEEIERERFATPQHIAESGREPVVICLTEGDMQALKQKYGIRGEK